MSIDYTAYPNWTLYKGLPEGADPSIVVSNGSDSGILG